MPTYEYVCTSCGNQWEEMQKISAPALTDCPKCLAASAKRQISGGNFILKGGGWYADLYSSSKASAGGASSSDNEAKSETKSETKTETKSSDASSSSAPAAPAAPATPAAKS